ncbi:helix-turn-helix transcriptional regulator [Aliiruegeria lutimaris]|uniref:Helix-turn-helix domain-containing protein n=1 Tax=Aliiruegeria lutimaris TaxID=571298 RepID=A0A1G9ESP9_9RHOB|nr:hypothetical protein [Aliiruegeria lutimaris]SDK79207.1 hypothetical protein SAMN04488026_105416 [Aliiruegeria lutimaris]
MNPINTTEDADPNAGWTDLPMAQRVDLLRNGIPHPGETSEEARCRLKHSLGFVDDSDLVNLLDKSADTLARMRVNGTGPVPIRVAREIFYDLADVRAWMLRHKDGVRGAA